jgi:hypothetical protein
VIDIETALFQQLLNIAQRQRIAKVPPDRTKYEAGFGLPPFEDRGSGSHFAILSRHQPATPKVATHPIQHSSASNHSQEGQSKRRQKPLRDTVDLLLVSALFYCYVAALFSYLQT